MEKKIKHLEMIQSIITRMSTNSFALKGWAVTLIVGIFVFCSKDVDKLYFLSAFIPTIFFGVLDAFYLKQERQFRNLYETVRQIEEIDIDFDLSITSKEAGEGESNYWSCLGSITVLGFYLPLVCVIIICEIIACL